MISRVLRQPHAQLTHHPLLDESYVFTFDQDVTEAVDGVRKGLEDEGMADLASHVKILRADGEPTRQMRRETLQRRVPFSKLPTIFLPRVLCRDEEASEGYRILDYDRDILGQLDWEAFHFGGADGFAAEMEAKLKRTIVRIDLDQKKTDQPVLDYVYEAVDDLPEEGLDEAFLVRQLLDVIPNPWQGMRVLNETLDALRRRGMDEERLYANRLDLLKAMKIDLREQVNRAAEDLFRKKLEGGDISLKLVLSGSSRLNWALAETLEIDVSDEERALVRKDGDSHGRPGAEGRGTPDHLHDADGRHLEKGVGGSGYRLNSTSRNSGVL